MGIILTHICGGIPSPPPPHGPCRQVFKGYGDGSPFEGGGRGGRKVGSNARLSPRPNDLFPRKDLRWTMQTLRHAWQSRWAPAVKEDSRKQFLWRACG